VTGPGVEKWPNPGNKVASSGARVGTMRGEGCSPAARLREADQPGNAGSEGAPMYHTIRMTADHWVDLDRCARHAFDRWVVGPGAPWPDRLLRRRRSLLLPADVLAAAADLAFGYVDAEDLDLDLVADLDDVLGALDLVVGQLADVQEALQPRLQFDEDAEVGQLGDLALLDLAGAVAAGDVALPGVVVHLLEAQGDPL